MGMEEVIIGEWEWVWRRALLGRGMGMEEGIIGEEEWVCEDIIGEGNGYGGGHYRGGDLGRPLTIFLYKNEL